MGTSLIKPILKTLRSITFECLGQAIWAQSPVVIHCALRHTTTADQLSIHWSRTDHQSLFCSVFPMLRYAAPLCESHSHRTQINAASLLSRADKPSRLSLSSSTVRMHFQYHSFRFLRPPGIHTTVCFQNAAQCIDERLARVKAECTNKGKNRCMENTHAYCRYFSWIPRS